MKTFNKIIAFLLAVALLGGVTGCGDKSPSVSSSKPSDKTSSSSSETVSEEDFDASLSKPESDDSIDKSDDYKETVNDSTSGGDTEPEPVVKRQGITYYVAADGTSKDGTSKSAPMSLATANQKSYADNDKILFKRGDTFYGSVDLNISVSGNSKEDRVYVGAYGSGENPVISAAKIISDESAFVKQGEFYVADLTDSEKYKGYVTEENVNNIGFFLTEDRTVFPSLKPTLECCVNEFDFYCAKGKIYIKSSENPIKVLGTLSFATEKHLVRMRSNTEYCDLTLRLSSGHGMNKGEDECKNIYVHDMVIEYIGGALQYASNTDTNMIRYGNGIEFYNGPVEDILIEKCIIRKCYDVAFTMQGTAEGYNNVTVRNCVMYHNKQSVEIFNEGSSLGVTAFDFSYNLCINSGNGAWGYEAFNYRTGVPCEFLFYNYYPEAIDIKYHHNIIFNPIRLYWWPGTTNMKQFKQGVLSYENSLWLGNIQLLNSTLSGQMGILRETYNKEILSKQHSLINADMSLYDEMYAAAEKSYSIKEIAAAAEKCGVR